MLNEIHTQELLNEADSQYIMTVKGVNDILDDLDLTDTKRVLTKSIILSLEETIADTIKDGDIANIPNFGTIRKNPMQQAMVKNYKNLRAARKHMTKEEYSEYAKSIYHTERQKDEAERNTKRLIRLFKNKNKKKYDSLVFNLGFEYADMWVKSYIIMQEVPFNQEVQDAFDNINNK